MPHLVKNGQTSICDVSHNQQLALKRALATATALGMTEEKVTIHGETTPLYDQNLPEGRFLSCVVTVEIETTEKEGDSG